MCVCVFDGLGAHAVPHHDPLDVEVVAGLGHGLGGFVQVVGAVGGYGGNNGQLVHGVSLG